MLADVFPETEQVKRAGLDCASDNVIWDFLRNGGFTIVSLDSDFADMAGVRGAPPKIIWLRCGNEATNTVAHLLRGQAAFIADSERDRDAACLELY
jgi:predicted nuclease of predicted toxin-antitoxin system